MPVVLAGIAWLPWVLLAGDGALRTRGPCCGTLDRPAGPAGAPQALAGWPAGAYLTWLIVAALPLRFASWRDWPGAALRLAGGAGLALLLAPCS